MHTSQIASIAAALAALPVVGFGLYTAIDRLYRPEDDGWAVRFCLYTLAGASTLTGAYALLVIIKTFPGLAP